MHQLREVILGHSPMENLHGTKVDNIDKLDLIYQLVMASALVVMFTRVMELAGVMML